ncbi:exosome complex component Rrp4 [Arctopsyche grandis]|uniref:exosome complex component Rrp4 n=1 Tax=Arctopsyche grandis TaxID=121162 RepID=UPI00406D6DAE
MAENIHIRLASERVNYSLPGSGEAPRIYTPGEIVSTQQGFMRGHGTYMESDLLKSSVAGVVEQVNKLLSVKPLKSRYVGEVGDVVVGRVVEVQQKRWKINTNSKMDSILLLSSINLPGGELRRRSIEDERMMRTYLKEGDLVSAEVQMIYSDGCVGLHTRSLKHGKLGQGILVKVLPSLVRRWKTHFHSLPCGVSIILGNNGFIWIHATAGSNTTGGFEHDFTVVAQEDRESMARVRNCIHALAASKIMLFDTSILYAYEESLKYDNAKDLIIPEIMLDIAVSTQYRISQLES